MTRVLVTAFQPYDCWQENSSWLTLIELTRWFQSDISLVTRRYPVDFDQIHDHLRRDLSGRYDFAVHLGQSPGCASVKLETTALNLRDDGDPILPDAPAAYRTSRSFTPIKHHLNDQGIPCDISNHAGTYLCNALLFLSTHLCRTQGLVTESFFIHLPITPAQSANLDGASLPSMAPELCASAVANVIEVLAEERFGVA